MGIAEDKDMGKGMGQGEGKVEGKGEGKGEGKDICEVEIKGEVGDNKT